MAHNAPTPSLLGGGGGVTSKDCCQIEISRHSINELPFWGSFNNIDTKKSFICLYVLTALACAILRIGLSPSFSIFFITGTYAIGITSTGIPFLNWNVKRHWHSILNVLWIQYCTFIYQTVYNHFHCQYGTCLLIHSLNNFWFHVYTKLKNWANP